MTFEEWWKDYVKPASIYTIQQTAKEAWKAGYIEGQVSVEDELTIAYMTGYEAGILEGIDRMYTLYNICPECKMTSGQHKMDCGRGR